MNRYTALFLLTAYFFRFDSAYSIFGVEGVPLEDYYEFGKCQTGVASVRVKRNGGTALGTANLIDIAIPSLNSRLKSLEGKVLITAAHVICKGDPELCSVRFMNENNESQTVNVLDFFIPDNYRDGKDIGFIVLKEPVDVTKFKPLKLNLSTNNESFSGKKVNIFGCTPVFGKVNSDVVIREGNDTLLRRGMTTFLDNCSNGVSELGINFYASKGMVSIFRDATRALSERDKERKYQIEEELKRLDNLINNAKSFADELTLNGKRNEVSQEQFNLHPVEVRKMFSKQIFYNGENIQDQLNKLEDTEDLDKSRLISEWENFIKVEHSGNKSIDIGTYQVKFYGYPPRLNGMTYHGDSGGSWVIDDEIVGLTQGCFAFNMKKFEVKQIESLNPSLGISEYFTQCEDIIPQPQSPLADDKSFHLHHATSIWSCRDWIMSTLEEINSQLVEGKRQ